MHLRFLYIDTITWPIRNDHIINSCFVQYKKGIVKTIWIRIYSIILFLFDQSIFINKLTPIDGVIP